MGWNSILTLTHCGGQELPYLAGLPESTLERIVEHGIRPILVTVLSAHGLQRITSKDRGCS